MPIFFQQDIDADTKVAVWKIEEEEDFFLKAVMPQRLVSHPHKKLQHLAGRYLLVHLYPDFPVELIQIADTRKPFLENEKYHFSIAHCGDYAAAIVSRINRVGVDAELVTEKVKRIRTKFVSAEEEMLAGRTAPVLIQSDDGSEDDESFSETAFLTMLWSVKEAVFKWYGDGNVDFKDHMVVKSIAANKDDELEIFLLFKKNEELFLRLKVIFFENLCLTYVVT